MVNPCGPCLFFQCASLETAASVAPRAKTTIENADEERHNIAVASQQRKDTMEAQPKIDVRELEQKIGQLQKRLAFVGEKPTSDASELFKIIHRPGWTTVVQVNVASQILEAMNQQAQAMHGLHDALASHVKASGG